jgi:hypothetical protein
MEQSPHKSLNKRALTSTFMLFAFLCLPVSGILLHSCRSATFSTYEHFLMSIHNVSALVFLVATLMHLTLNWSALKKYMISRSSEVYRFKKEMLIAFFTVLIIVGLFSSHALHTH